MRRSVILAAVAVMSLSSLGCMGGMGAPSAPTTAADYAAVLADASRPADDRARDAEPSRC